MKRPGAYDLGGTLAARQWQIHPELAALALLTGLGVVAIISGGDWPRFEQQLVGNLPDGTDWSGCSCSPRRAANSTALSYAAIHCDVPTIWVQDHVLPVLQTEPIRRGEVTSRLA